MDGIFIGVFSKIKILSLGQDFSFFALNIQRGRFNFLYSVGVMPFKRLKSVEK